MVTFRNFLKGAATFTMSTALLLSSQTVAYADTSAPTMTLGGSDYHGGAFIQYGTNAAALERRRRGYFDESDQVRVVARYSAEDRAVRNAWRARRDDGRRR